MVLIFYFGEKFIKRLNVAFKATTFKTLYDILKWSYEEVYD